MEGGGRANILLGDINHIQVILELPFIQQSFKVTAALYKWYLCLVPKVMAISAHGHKYME